MAVTVFQGLTPAPSNVTAVSADPASGNDFYGKVIPAGYGTRVVDGANIWASPVSSAVVGGKSVQLVDFAVSFGERSSQSNVRTRVVKLWLNDQVILDRTSDTPVRTSGLVYAMYDGNESQTFDPTIEKWQGKGNTPAYRGQIYTVFRNFSLTQFSLSALPTIRAELCDFSTSTDKVLDYTPMSNPPFPEWEVDKPDVSNRYYVDWTNSRLVLIGALDKSQTPNVLVKNGIRVFDTNTMTETSQVKVIDGYIGRQVGWLAGWPNDNTNKQPGYSGGDLDLTVQPAGAGPWVMPLNGYAVVPILDNGALDVAVVDPVSGRLMGKCGLSIQPTMYGVVEGVSMQPFSSNNALPGSAT